MLTAINTILEMAATLICVNYLFGKRYYFSIYDAVFMVAEVTLIESANYFGLSKGMALFGYVGIYIYELLKFKCSIRKANVNLVLVAIYCIFAQVICSMPVFALENWVSVDWVMLGINFLVLVLSVVISKTGYFYKVSQGIDNYTMLSKIAAGICLIGGIYLLIIYKMEEYLRRTDYIIFGIWTILIGVLIFSWQRERYEKIAKEKELELEQAYEVVYEQLLESIRRKQHDFHNQINAIYSHHLIAKDYDTLVSLQKEYCSEILNENRYARLVSNGSPTIIAFLYSKFVEAETKGCHITYDIKIDDMQGYLPKYKMIEILGILLDNAMEAVEQRDSKNITVKMLEQLEQLSVAIKNNSMHYEREEIMRFFEPGYSKKGEGRGIGLSKVREILLKYHAGIKVSCEKEEFVFEFILPKIKDSHAAVL